MSELEQLVVEQIPRLRRYARALTGDRLAADDLVQDCLERALSRLHRWRRGSNIRAWLFTIMHNLYVNSVRRKVDGPAFIPLSEDDISSTPPTQERAVEAQDLVVALAALPSDQREVVLLVGLEEMSYEQVAKVLNIPMGTVMSRLHRGRERLRQLMSGQSGPALRRVK